MKCILISLTGATLTTLLLSQYITDVFSAVRRISNFCKQVECHMYYNSSVVVHHLFRSVLTSSSSLVRFATRFFHEFTCAEKKHTRNMKQK